MSRRVQFDRYGPVDVLQVADVPRPRLARGRSSSRSPPGINPGEIAIRNGALDAMFPATFPSGQGSDFAGRVVETGPGVTEFAPGDEVPGMVRQPVRAGRLRPVRSASPDHPAARRWTGSGPEHCGRSASRHSRPSGPSPSGPGTWWR